MCSHIRSHGNGNIFIVIKTMNCYQNICSLFNHLPHVVGRYKLPLSGLTERDTMGNSCASGDEGDLKSKRKGGDSDGQRYSSRSLPDTPEANWPLFVSKYDYDSRTEDDLGFKKGDLLYIINTEDADWWYAQHKDSGDKGFAPSNYIAEYKSLDAEE